MPAITKSFLLLPVLAVLAACSRADTGLTTAERVKQVEERQKNDPNFHVVRKGAAPPAPTPAPAATAGTAVSTPDAAKAR